MGKRPNFLIIVADDLGYSDIGCFGSEIKTPHLDALAKNGARMTDFHAAAACSPTRAMLLSGTDSHIAGVGCMSEAKGGASERWNVKGHEGYLNKDVVALPELLQEAGYHTLISGKWHLGLKTENNPAMRGFDRSLALLPGCSNHYAYEPQFAPDQYHTFFERIPPLYSLDNKKHMFPPNTTQSEDGFYSTDTYANNLIDWFKEWKSGQGGGKGHEEKPFFAYLPFCAPHWPLQCSKEDREVYRGWYDDGPDALREKRFASLKKLGIYKEDVVPADVIAPEVSEWEEMSEEEKKLSSRSMEVYAGMVTSMDRAIGRVVDYLKSVDEFENTFLLFMSDNGAEGAAYEAIPVMGNHLMTIIDKYYDNSLENVGNHNSFVWYGPRWAQAATAPHRLYKMFSTEGGIRVPLIMHYPSLPHSLQNGKLLRAFTTVTDICPTILNLAGVTHPVPQGEKKGQWRGMEVAGQRGKSWVDYFKRGDDKEDGVHGDDDPASGWELHGRAALRKGKYKILFVAPAYGGRPDGGWQLYDMHSDPGETNDLSESKPEVLKELLEMWETYVEETGTVWGDAIAPVQKGRWGGVDEDVIGGDPMEQTRAWMRIGQKETPLPGAGTKPWNGGSKKVVTNGQANGHANGHVNGQVNGQVKVAVNA